MLYGTVFQYIAYEGREPEVGSKTAASKVLYVLLTLLWVGGLPF